MGRCSASAALALARISTASSQILVLTVIGRFSGAAELGKFSVSISVTYMAALLADFGLSTFLLTQVRPSAHPLRSLAGSLSATRLMGMTASMAFAGGALMIMLSDFRYLTAGAIGVFAVAANIWTRSTLHGTGRIGFEAASSAVVALLQAAFAASLSYFGGGASTVLMGFWAALLVGDAARLVANRGPISRPLRPGLGRTLPLAISQVLATAQNRGGIVLLQTFGLTLPSIAFYQLATRAYYLAPVLFESDGPVVAARRKVEEDWKLDAARRWKSRSVLIFATCAALPPGVTILSVVSAVPIVTGPALWAALGAALSARCLCYIPSVGLVLEGKQIAAMRCGLASACVHFVVAVLAVAVFRSPLGAALGLASGELVHAVLLVRRFRFSVGRLCASVAIGALAALASGAIVTSATS
jgi:hypothetical protein